MYCNVSYNRDCPSGEGCVVSAITNYTTRLTHPGRPKPETTEAFKFIVHLLGDITQPLHDEHQAFGGNKIPVTWDGRLTNLHRCWDDEMPNRVAGLPSNPTPPALDDAIASFSKDLLAMIHNGTFTATEVAAWTACVDPSTPETCALEWARDANAWICDYVLKSVVQGTEVNGTYFEGAKRVIQGQIAKGGVRLGHYLNNIVADVAEGDKFERLTVQEL